MRRRVHAARAGDARTFGSMRSRAATRSAPRRSAPARARRRSRCPRPARSTSPRPRTAARCRCACRSAGRPDRARRSRAATASSRSPAAGSHVAFPEHRRRHARRAARHLEVDRVARLRVRARAPDRRRSPPARRCRSTRDARARRRHDEHPVRRLPHPHVALERLRRRRARQGARRRSPTVSSCRCAATTSGSPTSPPEIAQLGVAGVRRRHRLDRADVVRDLGPHGRVPADARSDAGQRRRAEVADVPDGGRSSTRRSRRSRRRSCSTRCARGPRRRS